MATESDARLIVAAYFQMNADDVTIDRKDQARIRVAVYTGTTDADASTTVTLSGIPTSAIIVGVLCMINDSAGAMWRIHDSQGANVAAAAYRCLLNQNATNRQITMAEVGASLQSQEYRIMIFWVDRL